MEQLYYCDPELYRQCNKKNCFINGGNCRYTRSTTYAKKPITKVVVVLPNELQNSIEVVSKHDKE